MDINNIRKMVGNNQLQPALNACQQLELPQDFQQRVLSIKASYKEYNNHIIDGDMRHDDIEILRAGITKKILIFLSEYEIVCLVDLKQSLIQFGDDIQQIATHEKKEAVVEEVHQITNDLSNLEPGIKKEDIKPGLIKRIGDFLAKFQDKDSVQSKVLNTFKDGVNVVQQLGKKYNSIAQWFLLPQIPTVFL